MMKHLAKYAHRIELLMVSTVTVQKDTTMTQVKNRVSSAQLVVKAVIKFHASAAYRQILILLKIATNVFQVIIFSLPSV